MEERNYFSVEMTRGAMRFRRTLQPDAARRPSERTGEGVGRDGRPITGFSAASRNNLRWTANSLPWELVPGRISLLTFTYQPGYAPNDKAGVMADMSAVRMAWRRRHGAPMGLWAFEFTQQGIPHVHLYSGVPKQELDWDEWVAQRRNDGQGHVWPWLADTWHKRVGGTQHHRLMGVNVRPAMYGTRAQNASLIADYFWRESGKWQQKEVPDGFGGPGRYWGVWGRQQGFRQQVTYAEPDRAVYVQARRPANTLRKKKAGRKLRGLRGLDGLTVFGVDGRAVGDLLLTWAAGAVSGASSEKNFAAEMTE